jgi:nucleotide sugar dehydrogenase|tara:strand:- start:542 stop:1390 length:849 start_codon:yes stop_codon:yes gene_type:complete
MNIGIVGQGFVGTAINHGLRNFYKVYTYDLDKSKCNSTLSEVVRNCDIIFQCLPTPMKKTGECDLSIVRKSLFNINHISKRLLKTKNPIVIIKSTVPPGTTETLNKENENLEVIFSPEFLTEANSIDDFKNQTRIIIGGPRPATTIVKTMFRKAFPHIPIVKTGYRTSEMVKYFLNNFLTTKVLFANEMYQICQKLNIDYDKVTEYSLYDNRLGKSHLAVPGPDGDFGVGGHCFPKDLAAMTYLAKKLKLDTTILDAVEEKNNSIRKNRDWEEMPGRAISEE